jgi:hypothetical protein
VYANSVCVATTFASPSLRACVILALEAADREIERYVEAVDLEWISGSKSILLDP